MKKIKPNLLLIEDNQGNRMEFAHLSQLTIIFTDKYGKPYYGVQLGSEMLKDIIRQSTDNSLTKNS